MMWRRVMLVVSGIELMPIHVLDRVGRLARGLAADIELFHSVYEPEVVRERADQARLGDLIAARIEQRRARLERLADVLRDQGLRVDSNVRWDFPTYESVIRQARRHKPDLVIVPAIRLGETLRTLAYREARLIEECPAPVLFLKTREVYSKGTVIAVIEPSASADAAGLDDRVLGAAKTVAHALAESPVRLFGAMRPGRQPVLATVASAGNAAVSAPVTGPVPIVEDRLRRLAQRHEIAESDVHVRPGEPAAVLSMFAREWRAQMIVVGAAPPDTTIAHRAEELLEAVACDVLVVRTAPVASAVSAEAAPAAPQPA